MSNIDRYIKFITEQVRVSGGLRNKGVNAINEAEDVEAHGDGDTAGSYRSIDKIHAHIKAAGHTIHHDDDGKATKNPHVTALNQIKILPHKEKNEWTLVQKYAIGGKKK